MVQNLPTAEVYEKEFIYMPWATLIKEVQKVFIEKAPRSGTVLDLLCGPGYLVGKLQQQRPDLQFTGVDLEPEFIQHAKKLYPKNKFEVADAATWNSNEKFDVVLCTAGVHHLSYEKQEPFLKKISQLLKPDGFAIIADPYIDDYSNEHERKLAAAKLGYEYLVATINNGGTDDVIKAALGVMSNDVMLVEYKTSIAKMKPQLEKIFTKVEMHKTWPKVESGYGEYYFIVKK